MADYSNDLNWEDRRVLVVGDLMVDVDRHIAFKGDSPDQPGGLYGFQYECRFPGGAANVAANCRALGAKVGLFGGIGDDYEGSYLAEYCSGVGIAFPAALVRNPQRETTVKLRLHGQDGPLLRIDRDGWHEPRLDAALAFLAATGPYDGLLLSDYQKGVLGSPDFLSALVTAFQAQRGRTWIGMNPKPALLETLLRTERLFESDLIVLNDREYQAVNGLCTDFGKWGNIPTSLQTRLLLHTGGAGGLSGYPQPPQSNVRLAAHRVPDANPVGCGDAVFAAAALALMDHPGVERAARIANAAGAAKAARAGTLPVSRAALLDYLK